VKHFDGKRFFYPGDTSERGLRDFLKWRLTSRPVPWPKRVQVEPAALPPAPASGATITWIGHSTFLIRTRGAAWLTDPVFSERIGPVRGWGPRRVVSPALALEALPPIDGILVSHDHYDHCDLPSLRALARAGAAPRIPAAVTPLNYGSLLAAYRDAGKLAELDWWDTWSGPGGLAVQLVPARHWCRRRIAGTNERLWGGYFLRAGGRSIYFAGDSGFDEKLFREIKDRCGPPDLALIPIGAYEPRWFMREAHMNPAEAVRVHGILGSRLSIAMHWGTFALTDEAREAPPLALAAALAEARVSPDAFRVLPFGGSVTV
jgi:L-ascorbate metabolism protein UlaG (beta-lactamase superfamily)